MKGNYTPKQLEILKFIVDFRKSHGFSPTLEEIGNAMGVHRVTVHQHIKALEKRGAVERGPEYRRNIQVVDPDLLEPETDELLEMLKTHAGHEPIDIVRSGGEGEGAEGVTKYLLRCMQCEVNLIVAESGAHKEAPK